MIHFDAVKLLSVVFPHILPLELSSYQVIRLYYFLRAAWISCVSIPLPLKIPHIDLTVNFKKSEFKTLFKLWNTILFLECGNFCIYLSIFELLLRRILNFWTTDINWIVLVDEFYCFPMSWTAPKPVIAKAFYLIL